MSRVDHSDTAMTQRPALNGVFGENLAVQLESGRRAVCHHWDGHCRSLSFCAAVCIWFHLYAFFLFFVMTPNLAAGFSEFDM